MKLITFARNDAPATLRLGALRGQSAVDLNKLDSRIPADMIAFLEGGAAAMALAASALAAAKSSDEIGPGAYTLKAPIPRPGKIICVGLNYRDHVQLPVGRAELDIRVRVRHHDINIVPTFDIEEAKAEAWVAAIAHAPLPQIPEVAGRDAREA